MRTSGFEFDDLLFQESGGPFGVGEFIVLKWHAFDTLRIVLTVQI
ncbi:MAG: hypothetical protein ACYDC3_15960 [Candidatus Binataceae bacterium]